MLPSDSSKDESNISPGSDSEEGLNSIGNLYELGMKNLLCRNTLTASRIFEQAGDLAELVFAFVSLPQQTRIFFSTASAIQEQKPISNFVNDIDISESVNLFSDNFDIETYFANEEKREEIDQLLQLASDCWDDLQYAKAEKFYQKAAELSEPLHDLSRLLQARFWTAAAQRMQGKRKEALGVFTWLIEVAYDPELSHDLTEDDLWYVAGGFMDFVAVGRSLPEMPVGDLERVIDRGLDWLNSIGRRNWSAGLRLQRGTLWQKQNRKEAALAELEAALALCRRAADAPGYTLGTHLCNVADVLQDLERWEDAQHRYREVAEGYEFHVGEQCWAWQGLGQVAVKQQDWAEAERCALKALELARSIESPNPIMHSYDLLGNLYWEQRQIAPAIQAKIQAWHYARQMDNVECFYSLYQDFAEIRLYQAQQGNPQRFIPKAQQWLQRAMPLAVRLDRQVNASDRQTKIRELQAQCETLLQGAAN
jgi:tetratricopeptide (TPR) repeat protein